MAIKQFNELRKTDANIAGGKGASLGEMLNAKIPVPDGFVILAKTFDEFLHETNLTSKINLILKKVNIQEQNSVDSASQKISDLILSQNVPARFQKEIIAYFKKLNSKFVAVRSSATAEDGAEHAWAGQLNSYLNVQETDVVQKVKECWASLFTPRAIFYRIEKKLDTTDVSVAVVVQKMVNSEKSGIAFSVHPVTENYDELIIEAGLGLGEAIVSGQITPDSYVVNKNTFSITECDVNTQTKGLFRSKNGGNYWKELDAGEKQVLDKKQIVELSKLIVHIENHYGFPCDIEWAFEKGVFYIVQSRPITTLSPKPVDEKEVVVSHHSDLLTQDLILKGVFQYCSFKDFGTSFNFPFIMYENTTGNISYPKNQLEEIRNLDLKLKDFKKIIDILKLSTQNYKLFLDNFETQVKNAENKSQKVISFFDNTLKAVASVPYFIFEESLSHILEREGILQSEIPTSKTYASKSLDRLKIIVKKFGTDRTSNKFFQEVDSFCDEFSYLGMKYFGGNPWKREDVLDIINNMNLSQDKKLAKINLNPYAKITGELLLLRTKNWEYLCKGCYLFRKYINTYFPELDYGQLINIRIDDLLEIIDGSKKLSDFDYDNNFSIEITEKGVIIGESIVKNEITPSEDFLTGVSAHPGIIKGKAKVVLNSKDCTKVESEDILVAVMSTPDFLPAMYKAAAFVTDIGGITSHAAIVARELRKPCIIGTKVATQVLKDGDLVEVDANVGIVKKINTKSIVQKYAESLEGNEKFTFSGPYSSLFTAIPWSNNKYFPLYYATPAFHFLFIGNKRNNCEVIDNDKYKKYAKETFEKYYNEDITLNDLELRFNFFSKKADVLFSKKIINAKKQFIEAFDTLIHLISATIYVELVEKNIFEEVINKKISSESWNNATDPRFESFEQRWHKKIKNYKKIEEIEYIFADYYFIKNKSEIKKEIAKKKKELLIEKKLDSFKKLSEPWENYVQFVMKIRDWRKDPIAKLHTVMAKCAQKLYPIASDDQLANLNALEVFHDNLPSLDELQKRYDEKYVIHIMPDLTYEFSYDVVEEAEKFIEHISDPNSMTLEGHTACQGKATGIVKIIIDPKAARNFNKGDILVTSMTRPDFVPLMKKAGGIITNEGGVTSHAAIISRELKIPCIIGTKVATQVLKDGDLVEVDADNGVVYLK